ncbi:MAG TPA: DNA alkylation repair protein [Blastocatellia bacterium]|nr:DNA alkylation repair protein [Blastocatellia bacterium]
MSVNEIRDRLTQLGDQQKAQALQKFFKTGPGEYGEGDIFLGIRVPDLRRLVGIYQALPIPQALRLLRSPVHEERLFAILLMVRTYSKASEPEKERLYEIYLENTTYINNWDLVDSSAPQIVGAFLIDKDKKPLYRLAKSTSLWERRIAIMATAYFIKKNEFEAALRISEMLLSDREDLVHKAVGWMLREIGKRNLAEEELFLSRHYQTMPRTMLRYAIEKFPEPKRRRYLEGKI